MTHPSGKLVKKLRWYKKRGYCTLCSKWYPLEELVKLYLSQLNTYAYYCPVHKKQVRLKGRGTPMTGVVVET